MDSFLSSSVACIILSTDSHTAYIAASLTASVIAFITPCNIVGNAVAGEVNVRSTMEMSVSAVNAIFIHKLYLSQFANIRPRQYAPMKSMPIKRHIGARMRYLIANLKSK